MSYIDILIPLVAGLFCIFNPTSMIKPEDPLFETKRVRMKWIGFVLIGVALIYGLIKMVGNE